MPSYRRDRPSGGRPDRGSARPTSFRREEPEEESQFRRPPMFRHEGGPGPGPSEFASRPVSYDKRMALWERLVPQSEREDPHFDYGQAVFGQFRKGRGAAAAPPPPQGEAPRGYERGAERGAERGPERGPQRPQREPGGEPLIDAALFFDLGRIWNAVATLRQDSRFKVGSAVAVVRTAPQNEVHKFFRIDPADVTYFLEELSYSINAVKPRELPGRFLFQKGADGFVWLAYVEQR